MRAVPTGASLVTTLTMIILAARGRNPLLAAGWAMLATIYLIAVHLPLFGGHPWLSGPPRSKSAIIAASSRGASVRLMSSPLARPETTIAPTMSPASANAHRRVYQPRIRAIPPTSSNRPIATTNSSGAGSP